MSGVNGEDGKRITHVDLIEPRLQALVGRQLAWSPPLVKRVEAEVTKLC